MKRREAWLHGVAPSLPAVLCACVPAGMADEGRSAGTAITVAAPQPAQAAAGCRAPDGMPIGHCGPWRSAACAGALAPRPAEGGVRGN